MKEREITVNLKHFSREIFSPLFLQKEFFPTLQNKMKCRRKEIAARRCKCIVDGIVRKALSTGSFCTPGTQIKTPITAVNHKQLTSSASHYKETAETLILLCSEVMHTRGCLGRSRERDISHVLLQQCRTRPFVWTIPTPCLTTSQPRKRKNCWMESSRLCLWGGEASCLLGWYARNGIILLKPVTQSIRKNTSVIIETAEAVLHAIHV